MYRALVLHLQDKRISCHRHAEEAGSAMSARKTSRLARASSLPGVAAHTEPRSDIETIWIPIRPSAVRRRVAVGADPISIPPEGTRTMECRTTTPTANTDAAREQND